LYKIGGEDGVGDASEKGRRGDQDERGKTQGKQGNVRAAVFNRCRTKRVLERTSCVVDAARMEMI
jgi:hypothetical protein